MQKNYKVALLKTKKVLMTNKKAISKTLSKLQNKMNKLRVRDEKIQEFKREANAERQKSVAFEQALARARSEEVSTQP